MNPSVPVARRAPSLRASLGVGERMFATPAERRFVGRIDDGLELVEQQLDEAMRSADTLADTTSRYLLSAGGKRIRPTLTLLIAQLGEGVTDAVVRAAVSVEMTHLASLYHDDVMDEAPVRRGVPSAHVTYGNNVAILTGDLLFARASLITAELGVEGIRMQAETFARLCLGQLHETTGPGPDDDPVAHYIQVLSDKTGSLIATAARAGIMFSGADRTYLPAVAEFGEKVGVAFQLVDDVIDLAPAGDRTGKITGNDLRAGVVTLPLLHLRRAAATDAAAADLVRRIERDVTGAADDAVTSAPYLSAVTDLREHEATAATRAVAHRWADEAVAAIAPLPSGPVKRALTRFAESVVDRTR
ncbi:MULTISPECIES: polyprenyl synthetase family protein [unclassified Curtobacterium]|uniref:polyprenyl synthetase family protein n=1 Tax=unclassified Curtobacterium TaxID=257496 RepID=UPI000DA748E4|nr:MULTISPECIES: polyprenyl synthetase family protein [unclassified Curtobacterium]PZE74276.1 polyprenyl synthetase family protein [Curtobacterium sp. MCBD17_019]WIB66528.1 polyprenyl synthetase family protein [Curtobacterium sp. MCBD17_035]WIE53689.1 polyprenyl synthetase family protein [Curtobacterium sp. MCBD17_003]